MGDRAPVNQVPLSVRIPVSNIRPASRPLGGSSVNYPRPPMVNSVYVLPKPGGANQSNMLQMRGFPTGQPNGVIAGPPNLAHDMYAWELTEYTPGSASVQSVPTASSGVAKLVGFLNQLLELSRTAAADTHSAVVRLIQALVNAELDANSFCTQLHANLKSANTSTDILPFVKENIDTLRRDLAAGVYRLPNINPPSGPFFKDGVCNSVALSVITPTGLSLPSSAAVAVQVRPNVSVCIPSNANPSTLANARLALPGGAQPRLVGTLINSTSALPTTTGIATGVSHPNRPLQNQPPLLAPAPPRASFTTVNVPSITNPKHRPVIVPSSVTQIIPSTAAPSVVTTRVTATPNAVRSSYPTLRPVLAPSPITSSSSGIKTNTSVPSLVRTKLGSLSNSAASLISAGVRSTLQMSPSTLTVSDRPGLGDRLLDTSEDGRTCSVISPSKDQPFFPPAQIRTLIADQSTPVHLTDDAITCLSHGLQAFVRTLLARLSIVVSHRLERLSDDARLTQTDSTRECLKFLQKLDEHDRMRQSELEKDLILKAAKSRSRNEDPDQIRMREMARRIATEDYEREKQHQANLTALHAIGPQRKRRFDAADDTANTLLLTDSSTASSIANRDCLINNANQARLSLVTTNRLGTFNPTPGVLLSQSGSEGSQSNLAVAPMNNLSHALTSGEPPTNSYSLSHTSRVHRATLKDIQVVLSKTPRLKRTLTFYRTHWRSV
ncbi:hypothetical protein EG68_04909 [Paragonimus skrjabini miyazakii]|uniref:TAFH domain-containing protein n=1 Tax=Paragonimus skrjabini miyazakii TaxID=59628 RepID=A0A8S9YEV5_9TREM|nr:hypothetical protein EG68_04909 [Paragonimus skrjabini miyazakii]